MVLNFPANPVDGQIYNNYYYSTSIGAWNSLSSTLNPIPSSLKNVTLTTTSAAGIPVIVQGISSQTAKLQEWRNSSGTTLASISPSGGITADSLALSIDLPVTEGGTGVSSFTSGAYIKGAGSGALTAQVGIPAGDIVSGTLGYDRVPAGTVIQATNTKYTPLVSTGSTSFVNFTNVTFTPKRSNSLILIQAMFSTSHGGAIQVRNTGGSSLFTPINAFHVFAGVGGPDYGTSTIRIPYYLQCTEVPGTTATRTYYFDMRVYSGTFAINENGSGVSSITIMEIAQ